ncbi:ComEA family DNA-binding protein, partial [Burkholderia gladioli]
MLKKLLLLLLTLSLSLGTTFAAAVEVNTADQAALESVKGLGPVKSKAIIDERAKNGPFKSADDLASRVKGLGQKSVANLEAAGLTIGGSSTPPTGAKASQPATRATKTQAGTPAPAPSATTPSTSSAPAASTTASAAQTGAAAANAASQPAKP